MPRALLCASLLFVFSSSCTTTDSDGKASIGPWIEPSPGLEQQIREHAQKLPWTHGIERVEIIQWFAGVGEPAYPVLLALVLDPRPDVAGSALAALGATRDSRLVEPLRELPWPGEEYTDLALERARTLLRLGDWSMVPHLIGGLEDERLLIRALCGQALFEATHERLDFDPNASPEERGASVARWRAWWQAKQRDPLLEARPKTAGSLNG